MLQKTMNFCQLSNILGIFPILLAVQFGLYPLAGAMTASTILSILYHYDETNEHALMADMGGCVLLSACGFYIVMNNETNITFANLLSLVYGVMAMVFFVKAGEPGEDTYQLYHTGWHICAFFSMSVFVFSYIHSTVIPEESGSVISKDMKPVLRRTIRVIPGRFRALRRRLFNTKNKLGIKGGTESRAENPVEVVVERDGARYGGLPHEKLGKRIAWKRAKTQRSGCAHGSVVTVTA